MVYLLKNKRNKKAKKRLFLFLVLIVLGLLFYFTKISLVANWLNNIGRPLWLAENYLTVKFSEWGDFFQAKEKLAEENRQLKNQLKQINSQLLSFESILKENAELKEMLGRTSQKQKTVLANILTKPNFSPYDSLILDVGKDFKIKKGDKIIFNGFVLGEIEEVFSQTAKARLYSFPNDKLEVAVGFDKVMGEAQGKGGGNFEIKFPQDIAIQEGDLVFLSDTGQTVGIVVNVITTPEDPLKTILFKTPLNIFELRWVQILIEE